MARFRSCTTYLLITTFLTQSCLPAFSCENDIAKLEKSASILKFGAISAPLSFKAHPEQTAAGSLVYARDGGRIKILFGLRDDEDSYCNPGGKSDSSDGFLEITGARETAEETLNIYCPHPDILKVQPFVDLYSLKPDKNSQDRSDSGKAFLNRTYFIEQEFVSEELINERLKNGANLNLAHHQQEYRSFIWVLGEDLLKAVKAGNSQFTTSDTQMEINLFGPLFQTLSTHTAKGLLKHIISPKLAPSFEQVRNYWFFKQMFCSSDISSLEAAKRFIGFQFQIEPRKEPLIKNHIHCEGVFNIQKSPKISWMLPDIDYENQAIQAKERAEKNLEKFIREKIVVAEKDNFENRTLDPNDHEKIEFNKDAFGRNVIEKNIQFDDLSQNQKITLDPLKNRSLFGKAVAAKAAAGLQIKKLFRGTSDHLLEDDTPSLSDLLLQAQLGSDYVKPEDINNPESRRQADILNLKKYYDRYSQVEGELKRDTTPLEGDFEGIAEALEIERRYKKNWAAIHHASKPGVKYLWVSSTALHELLTISPFLEGTNPAMRATDIYFCGHKDIRESSAKTGTGDYVNGNESRRLCGNMAVTAGIKTTCTSSNSVEYWMNSHSVLAPSTIKRFEESAQLLGMVDTSYLPYQSLFAQYFDVPRQSAWTVVLINLDILDTYSYPAHGGGSFFNPGRSEDTMPSSKARYEQAHISLADKIKVQQMQTSSLTESTTASLSERVGESIAEMRLLLHPSIMFDSDKINVFSIDRHPLTSSQKKKFESQLLAANIYDLGQWLSCHFQMMPDSLQDTNPPIKKLYALAHKGVTGEAMVETVSGEAFPHLVRNGHYEGAKQFFTSYPAIVEELKIPSKDLILSAIRSGSKKVLKFILEDVAKGTIENFFSKEDITAMILSCIVDNQLLKTHQYIIEHYDLTTIDPEVRRQWAYEVLAGKDEKAIDFFHNHVLPLDEVILDQAIGKLIKNDKYLSRLGMAKCQTFSKDKVADKLVGCLTSGTSSINYRIEYLLGHLLQEGITYQECLPTSGNSLFFYFPYLAFYSSSPFYGLENEILGSLQEDSSLFGYKNKEGLNILQFIQKSYLEGKNPSNYVFWNTTLKNNMEKFNKSFIKESYQPFLIEFEDIANKPEVLPSLPSSCPFGEPSFQEWRSSLQNSMDSGTVADVLGLFQQIPDPTFLLYYNLKNVHDYFWSKRTQSYAAIEKWGNSVLEALKAGDKEQYETLKEHLPVNIATSIWNSSLSSLIQEFPEQGKEIKTIILSHTEKASAMKKEWEEKLKTLVASGVYKDLFPAIDEALKIPGDVTYLETLLKENMPSMFEIYTKSQEKTIPSYEIPGLLSKPDEFLEALSQGKITPQAIQQFAWYELFQDKNLLLVGPVLKKLYPDPLDLATQPNSNGMSTLESIITYDPFHEGVFKAFLEHGGCFNILTCLSPGSFFSLFRKASNDLWKYIETKSPEIFSYNDAFLEISIDQERCQNFDFIKNNLEKLKTVLSDEDGTPILFSIFRKPDLVCQVIDLDPTVLTLKSRDGLGVEHLINHLLKPESEEYVFFMKLLEKYRR